MIKQEKLICMILVASGSLVFFGTAHCAPMNWRRFVSSARIDYRNHEYKKAISVYTDAIHILETDSPNAEAKYDLYLNLAEAYRLNNQLTEAEATLKKVEPVLSRGTWIDPLIQVRYWRRRGSLYATQRQFRKCGEAALKANRILRQLLPEHGVKELIAVIGTMNNAGEWSMSAALVTALRSYPLLDKRSRVLIEDTVTETSRQLRLHLAAVAGAPTATTGHNAKEAESILGALTEIDPDPKALLILWVKFLSLPEAPAITPQVKEQMEKLLATCQKLQPQPSCWKHLLQGKILENTHQLLEAELEFEKACSLATQHGDEAERSASYGALTSAISSYEQLRPASIELLQEEQRLTSPPYEYLWKFAALNRFSLHNVRVRLRLATEYARADKIADAESTLSGISSSRTKHLPLFALKVLTPQLEICRAMIRAGQHPKAELLYSRLAKDVAVQLRQQTGREAPDVKAFFTRLAALNEETKTELARRYSAPAIDH